MMLFKRPLFFLLFSFLLIGADVLAGQDKPKPAKTLKIIDLTPDQQEGIAAMEEKLKAATIQLETLKREADGLVSGIGISMAGKSWSAQYEFKKKDGKYFFEEKPELPPQPAPGKPDDGKKAADPPSPAPKPPL